VTSSAAVDFTDSSTRRPGVGGGGMNSSNISQEKNEMIYMRIKIRVFHKAYKHAFKQLYLSSYQDL
jgi:hypothetical protein